VADRYWVGGTGTWNTTSTTVWSATSGGASGASVPTAADSVFFDQAGTFTITLTGALLCLDITVSAGTYTFTSTGTIAISGSMSLLAGTVWDATGNLTFNATTTGKTVTTNGVIMSGNITFNGVGGSWTLGSALTTTASRSLTLTRGTLNLSTFTLTIGAFSSSNANTRTIAFGTGNITLLSNGSLWTTSTTAGLSTTGTQVVNVSYTGASAVTITSGSLNEANSISFNYTAGTYSLTLSSGTQRNLNFTGFAGTVSNAAQFIYGNLTLAAAATYTGGLSSWTFAATSTGKTITTNGKTMDFPITFDGVGGSWILQDALTMGSTRRLSQTNGTLDLNGKTLTVGSDYRTATGTKNLTFNGGTLVCPAASAIAFNNLQPTNFTTTAGTGTGTISMTAATAKTFVGGGSTFNCTINQGGAGALTITGANTFNNITNTVQPASVLFTAGTTTTFNNFNLSGTAGNLITIASATAATHTLSKASGTVSVDYLSITNSIATGGAAWYAGANSTNVSGNTGWIFTAPPGGLQTLLPSLYTNTNTFYLTTITQTGPPQTLTPDRYDNTNVFYDATVSSSNTLTPDRYDNTNVFYAATISASNELIPDRYDNTNIFYAATVIQPGGTQTLIPARYDNVNTLFSPTVSAVLPPDENFVMDVKLRSFTERRRF